MIYKILADTVVLIHFLWIVFLLTGALFGRKNRYIRLFHISGLIFALFIQSFDLYCPLTHLETWLRTKHNPSMSYEGSFIIYYLERVIYVEIPHWVVLMLTVLIFVFNIFIYSKSRRIKSD